MAHRHLSTCLLPIPWRGGLLAALMLPSSVTLADTGQSVTGSESLVCCKKAHSFSCLSRRTLDRCLRFTLYGVCPPPPQPYQLLFLHWTSTVFPLPPIPCLPASGSRSGVPVCFYDIIHKDSLVCARICNDADVTWYRSISASSAEANMRIC